MVNSVLFVGGGTASFFTAYELIQQGFKGKITIIEMGKDLKDRNCPKDKTGECIHCKNCAITRGFGVILDLQIKLSNILNTGRLYE